MTVKTFTIGCDIAQLATTRFYSVTNTVAELFVINPGASGAGSLGYVQDTNDYYNWNGTLWLALPVAKLKPTNEARVSTTTLTADSFLSISLPANTKHMIEGVIFYDTAAAADFKFGFTGPASPTLVRISRRLLAPGDVAFSGITTASAYEASVSITGAAGAGIIFFNGIIHNGVNAGNLVFLWAQNTSNAAATTVLAGSQITRTSFI